MADLSNLLGAVYGETSPSTSSDEDHMPERDPDGPPTPVEKAADDRGPAIPLADDLAAALSEALVAQEDDDFDIDTDDGAEDPRPQMSPERAAAVELMHASRPDSEPFGPFAGAPAGPPPVEERDDVEVEVEVDQTWPEPALAPLPKIEPIAIDDLPYATDEPKPAPKRPSMPAPALAAMPVDADAQPVAPPSPGRWERSNDDILPTKGGSSGKKFFSLSLRRG
jgi:hypothetical protein